METLKRVLVVVLKLVLSSGAATLIASIVSTQRVLGALSEVKAQVSVSDRLSMTLYDAIHFGWLYWIFIFLAFSFAFFAAWTLHKGVKFGRSIIFTVAGMVAMLIMLLAMEQVFFGVPIVGGARDIMGLLLQMVAGGIGGFLFAKLTAPKIAT